MDSIERINRGPWDSLVSGIRGRVDSITGQKLWGGWWWFWNRRKSRLKRRKEGLVRDVSINGNRREWWIRISSFFKAAYTVVETTFTRILSIRDFRKKVKGFGFCMGTEKVGGINIKGVLVNDTVFSTE